MLRTIRTKAALYYPVALRDTSQQLNCEIDEVQNEVMGLVGWQKSLGMVSAVLLTIPYDLLFVNRYGRRLTLALALLGGALSQIPQDCYVEDIYTIPRYKSVIVYIELLNLGYKLQKTPMAHDAVNLDITNAHIVVTMSQWDAKRLGQYYESIATPIETWTPEIMEYRNAAKEYGRLSCQSGIRV